VMSPPTSAGPGMGIWTQPPITLMASLGFVARANAMSPCGSATALTSGGEGTDIVAGADDAGAAGCAGGGGDPQPSIEEAPTSARGAGVAR
jgi:hypothetical protein